MICHVFLSTPSAKDAGKHSIKIHAAKYTSHANRPCIARIAANVLEHTCLPLSVPGVLLTPVGPRGECQYDPIYESKLLNQIAMRPTLARTCLNIHAFDCFNNIVSPGLLQTGCIIHWVDVASSDADNGIAPVHGCQSIPVLRRNGSHITRAKRL